MKKNNEEKLLLVGRSVFEAFKICASGAGKLEIDVDFYDIKIAFHKDLEPMEMMSTNPEIIEIIPKIDAAVNKILKKKAKGHNYSLLKETLH